MTSVSWASRGVEEAAGRVGEPREDRVRQLPGGDEPALVERRLVQREQAVGEKGVVLEDARPPTPGRPSRSGRAGRRAAGGARGAARRRPSRAAIAARSLAVRPRAGRLERAIGVGKRRDREPVPARERLVVAGRLRRVARRLEQRPRAVASRRPRRPASSGSSSPSSSSVRTRRRIVRPSQLPVVGHVVRGPEEPARRRPERARTSSAVQTKVAPSSPFGVGVLARGERRRRRVAARGAR